jgi:CelD/BcsL family acetyltransferase involved in cellulose biosynthesis
MPVTTTTDPAPSGVHDDAASVIASARRAVVADRYAANSFTVEWRSLAKLDPIAAAWRDLAGRALEPNVFYEPDFALPAATVFGAGASAVLVWAGTSPQKLLGFFPARAEARRYGVKFPVLVGWTHPYAPLGTPLVDREAAEPVIAAWLGYVANDPALPQRLLLPLVPEDGPFAVILDRILYRARMPSADFDRHARAQLAPHDDRADYIERSMGTRRLKELRRLARRLGERGALIFTVANDQPSVASAIEDFFSLEAGGWKGQAGTAAVWHDDVSYFFTAALDALSAAGKVAINRILLDGRPIAATITLRSADAAWLWKIAYDEAFARYSPGVMLTIAVTEGLLDAPGIARTDSCATADHPMIDRIWRERLPLCDRLIGLAPEERFGVVRGLEKTRRRVRVVAKKLRELAHTLAQR